MKYIGLFGGSFSPVHVGHIRLALEVLEYTALPYALERVELIPCATPAHKAPQDLLPFALRYAMLEATCAPIAKLHVNAMESERSGTSYTWHTLENYTYNTSTQRLLFMEGIENLLELPLWYRGLELPVLADIGVVPRGDGDTDLFIQTVLQHWPKAHIDNEACPTATLDLQGHKAHIYYMPIPRLDISSSYIRQRWLKGGSLHALMPDAALEILQKAEQQVTDIWK